VKLHLGGTENKKVVFHLPKICGILQLFLLPCDLLLLLRISGSRSEGMPSANNFQGHELCGELRTRRQCFVSVYRVYSVITDNILMMIPEA
jgi:hypothetical protein